MKQNFHQRFLHFIREYKLFTDIDKLLVTVSGGIDSVVLVHLLKKLDFHFSIIHCNFKLREEESEGDELFVSKLADKLNVPIYIKHFDTGKYAEQKKLSIQMAARELRYQWFEEVRANEKFDYIITAHHKDDLAETVLLNLSKGSVLSGLHGIKPKNGDIIRPLLWATKKDIAEYASKEKISFREDSSNASDKYQRNLIRHKILPEFEKLNPSFSETIFQTSVLRGQISDWFEKYCAEIKSKSFQQRGSVLHCDKNVLAHLNEAILFELIREFGFNSSQAIDLFGSLHETEAKEFVSSTHRLVKDRSSVSIAPLFEKTNDSILSITGEGKYEINDLTLQLTVANTIPTIDELKNPAFTFLDYEKLNFPLTIRIWQEGDSFHPYGMKGKKKVSDYLTNIKLGKLEKENQTVMLSGNDICWIVDKRIDDAFKIDSQTKTVLRVEINIESFSTIL